MKILRNILFFFIVIFISNCARTGRPEGGPKDEDAPLFVVANPPYETTNFSSKEIKIEFDEFVTLKELNKQLIVSPPLKNPPLISPQGSPSKNIKIEILDTLQKNTTYIFNFGNAVQDNNEGNVLENFKYVFSTGNYIDSLTTAGFVKDAKSYKKPKKINVLLYKLDSSYTDSIIYKRKPNYVTSALDTTVFKFTNIKKGKYFLVALEEPTSDYLYNPKTDKIGFRLDTITLPKDSILINPIEVFKEIQPYRFRRAKEISKGKIQFGFEGERKNFRVRILSETPKDFFNVSKFETDKDTLNYWYTPFEADSLNFEIINGKKLDTAIVRLRKKKEVDSLILRSTVNRYLHFRDTFFIKSNNPIIKLDTSKFKLINKDSLKVNFSTLLLENENKIGFLFKKEQKEKYLFTAYPNAFIDIYSKTNDTIQYRVLTKELEDYGRITLNVVNPKSKNLIIQLLTGNNQNKIIENISVSSSKQLVFDLLEPKKYTIRAIFDDNKNNKWDTGDYLKKILPENIIYYKIDLELRANYFLEETFTVNK